MAELDFLRADLEPERAKKFVRKIYRQWTRRGRDAWRYADEPAKLIHVSGSRVSALLLSVELADNIRKALCIAHEY
jgi:hypothetical protein